ncbi:MAG: diguanylate cyclase [Planctomycetota bacterium]|jgi:diguanylate cyclase (GGDEF)-like protein/PAS domain S-box-containing protein|nr:diguanylate cyclase [Planctomycetota bacterium]
MEPNLLFKKIFESLRFPVIACRSCAGLPVMYMNAAARLFLSPSLSIRKLKGKTRIGDLRGFLSFKHEDDYAFFTDAVLKSGVVDNFHTSVYSFENEPTSTTVIANSVALGEEEYAIIYLVESDLESSREEGITEKLLSQILHEAYHEDNIDNTIQTILALAGRHSNVSRTYIFEDISPEMTRNTYEWCAPGVAPAIQDLQNLRKSDYNYDVIMSTSMYIYSDTRDLPESDREILYDMQGIKSIAILALFHHNKPLGYIGFDDTVNFRKWTRNDIRILEGIASIVSALIGRRNAEREIERSRQMMQTITDNLDDLIYVNDLETGELKFISKSLALILGMHPNDLIGGKCWEALHEGQTEQCPYCPIPKLYDEHGNFVKESYIWEFQNVINGKWYMVKDNIITWIDGYPAHLATAVDITYRKQYEEQLKYSASTDAMTEVYNREWGYNKLKAIMAGHDDVVSTQNTLAFIDIDNLKNVNDSLGHQMGDELIINMIQNISACIRKEDVICRWGGDEFLLILRCDLDVAEKVMEKIHFAMDHFNYTEGKPYTLSVSGGLVRFDRGAGLDVDEIIAEADRRMYEFKRFKKETQIGSRRFTQIHRKPNPS